MSSTLTLSILQASSFSTLANDHHCVCMLTYQGIKRQRSARAFQSSHVIALWFQNKCFHCIFI